MVGYNIYWEIRMIAGLIVLFFTCLILVGLNNHAQIKLREKESTIYQNIWHSTSAALRGILFLVVIYSYFGCSGETVKLWVLAQLFWWLLFDELLNKLRGKSLFYVGYTDIIDKSIRHVAGIVKLSPELTGILIKVAFILITLLF